MIRPTARACYDRGFGVIDRCLINARRRAAKGLHGAKENRRRLSGEGEGELLKPGTTQREQLTRAHGPAGLDMQMSLCDCYY